MVINIHHYFHNETDQRVAAALVRIEHKLAVLEINLAHKLDALLAKVQEQTTLVQGVALVLAELKAIRDSDVANDVKIQQISDVIDVNDQVLSDALAANVA